MFFKEKLINVLSNVKSKIKLEKRYSLYKFFQQNIGYKTTERKQIPKKNMFL